MTDHDAPPLAEPTGEAVKVKTTRAFVCRCGRPVFFRNSECLACHTPLGYEPRLGTLFPIEPAGADAGAGLWRRIGAPPGARLYHRCANLETAAACNWLVPRGEPHALDPPQCRCCRLNRTLPDLSIAENAALWRMIELAKRRLVSSLIGLGLPLRSRVTEDPGRGLAFDLLHAVPGGPRIMTGHDNGVITLDIEEADDAVRERRRQQFGEPYRTLLGHLRHESGHYYWQLLVDGGPWLEPFRALFGDERTDYAAALKRHYEAGSPADWGTRHVSAYAASHPWEDWAETWAHYMHMVDTLDTAGSFGLRADHLELSYERYTPATLDGEPPGPAGPQGTADAEFLALLNGWMELTGVLNELSRSMGVADFYPFVLSAAAVRKVHFVHRVVAAAAAARQKAAADDAGTDAAAEGDPALGAGTAREDESADPVGDGHSDADFAGAPGASRPAPAPPSAPARQPAAAPASP